MSQLNLISLLGLVVMIVIALGLSSHKRQVNWRLVVVGVMLQFLLAAVLFQSQNWTFDGRFENGILFAAVDGFFKAILFYVGEGSGFMFGINGLGADDPTNPKSLLQTFAFGVLPTVIFFAALMSILYHLGVMQVVIRGMAWVMRKTLGTTGPESLAAAANVLVGHTEAPLVIKPYVAAMTRSELNALMVGGFSTISGSLMAIFVNQGVSAGHILSASIISAPAALVIAKILQPETETPVDVVSSEQKMEKNATNVIEAAAIGASDGMKLAINIAAMLIAFLALIAMLDAMIGVIGEGVEWIANASGAGMDLQWSLSGLFGIVFYPLAWLMGIEAADCGVSGDLLGKKMVVNEFVAYYEMSQVNVRDATVAVTEAADGVSLSDRSKTILTYALCGFSNFGAIGIQIGGIGPLAPERRGELAQLGLRAMFGGMLACCMTACMAGIMYGVLR
jgi:CNT family concentrative nucleoside transporter